ncbi:MAG: atypical dual specificity phosphatase [Pirellulaceae bacterium]|jgi:atypical dual specificity phosphatase
MSPTLYRLYARTVFYPTLMWNMLLGRWIGVRRWWDRINSGIILGALPLRRDVVNMHKDGVRAVVNTCEEYAGPVKEYERHGIDQFRMPTIDFTHPKLEDVEAAVEFMKQNIDRGETVYVHCKAGRARSATVVLCYLIAYEGMTPEEGQKFLLEKRPHINPRLTQRPVVQEFYAKHGGLEKTTDATE